MKSCIQGAEAATCLSKSYRIPFQSHGGLIIKGLLACAALITILLITISSSSCLFKAPNARTLFGMLPFNYDLDEGNPIEYEHKIKEVFERASMPNRMVILTTMNEAWAKEGTMINLFLESFWIGNGTQRLLQHLIFICVDQKAYERCLVIHPHCLIIKTHGVNLSQEQVYLSTNYIKLVWRRIKFLKTVLEMNFDFVYTDTDVLWFRDPFPLLQKDTKLDIQVSSDNFNNIPWDIHNTPNSGFMHVRANKRTVNFFKYWYKQRKRDYNLATQSIFHIMKFDKEFQKIGANLRFLDPQLFGGFCTIEDTDMTKSITMHATCCKGLKAKSIDLRKVLEGWKKWKQLHLLQTTHANFLKSDGSFNKQINSPPCNSQKLIISPKFDAPSACIQSLSM